MRSQLVDNLGTGAGSKMLHGMDPHTAARVSSAMKGAFIHALTGGLTLSCAIAATGAVVALVLVEPKHKLKHHAAPAPQAEAAAEAVGV